MRTPSLFSHLLTLCVVVLCGFLPACVGEDADPAEPDEVDVSDFAVQAADGSVHVLVCHVQSADAHEIEVGFSAVRSHLNHGDFLGPCELPPG